ncbi:MAG: DUF934 domain-containing protein [Proteobacteria bacterium]|nr:DUF934 domain-containing protein [Pseudomonadota bacterium]
MPTIIKHQKLAADDWKLIQEGEAFPASGDVIVPLSLWLAKREILLARIGRTGVWLKPDDEPSALATDFAVLPLIAVHFPAFTDGRGYSSARLLRERYGYGGELRAIGDVLRDNVFYLSRVGFDAIALREGEDAKEALSAFKDFTEAYQISVERPQPLFRRRLSA